MKSKIALIQVKDLTYRITGQLCTMENQLPELFSKDFVCSPTEKTNKTFSQCINIKPLSLISKLKRRPQKIELLKSEGELIHERFGYILKEYLNKLKTVSTGLTKFLYDKTAKKCSVCMEAKMT